MLSVKIGDIWSGIDKTTSSIEVSKAQAQQQPVSAKKPKGTDADTDKKPKGADADTDNKPKVADAGTGEGKPPMEAGTGEADAGKAADKDAKPQLPMAVIDPNLTTDDPTLLTPVEIELLQQLAKRRDRLTVRERELQVRVGLMAAAERRMEKKIAELQNLRGAIKGLVKTFEGQQDKKLQSLVKIYENMKPKDAARIFEALEMPTLLDVAERMKERKLAAIMSKMNPERAREVTVELRRSRERLSVGAQLGG